MKNPFSKTPEPLTKEHKSLVYYGPHPCQRCDPSGKLGTLIVKAGNGAPDDMEYDFVHNSHYPNHVWKQHKCTNKNRVAQKLGAIKSIAKSKSSAKNGSLGGRPRAK